MTSTFATPIVNPITASLFRRTSYVSNGVYQAAPTAVSASSLTVRGTPNQNAQQLAQVIARASAWIDHYCFHRPDGTLAASQTTDAAWVKPRGDGSLNLICNYTPILEVDAVLVGGVPSQMTLVDQNTANMITIGQQVIRVPASWTVTPVPSFAPWPISPDGRLYCQWTYVNGFPLTTLAAPATAGASSISVNASVPGGSSVYGVYSGTPLTIHDPVNGNETVVVSSVSGLTLNISGTLEYAHAVPPQPDTVLVTALPEAIEQACILLTSCLIKTRGASAMVMPSTPGGVPSHQALLEAGALEDYDIAVDLLEPYVVTFQRS